MAHKKPPAPLRAYTQLQLLLGKLHQLLHAADIHQKLEKYPYWDGLIKIPPAPTRDDVEKCARWLREAAAAADLPVELTLPDDIPAALREIERVARELHEQLSNCPEVRKLIAAFGQVPAIQWHPSIRLFFSSRQYPADTPSDTPSDTQGRILSFLSRIVTDLQSLDLAKIVSVLESEATVNDKLCALEGLLPLGDATAEQLAALLSCSKQAVLKTDWWRRQKAQRDQDRDRRRGDYPE